MDKKRRDSGFTLLEMVIAILVVSVMIAVVVPHFTTISKQAERTACEENQQAILSALSEYQLQYHSYPTGDSQSQLNALVSAGLLQSVPNDPGGGTYIISVDSQGEAHVTCTVHGSLGGASG